ncbi:MAG: DUF4159 domain-containing protein [Phycisphaerae bacterium]|nr:DUF4159 domain-containing protein [Phycisphaerae bacterium]
MMNHRHRTLPLLAAMWATAFASANLFGQAPPKTWQEQPLTPQLVDRAVARGVKYLWASTKPDQFWEMHPAAAYHKAMKENRPEVLRAPNSMPGTYGAHTSLVLLALLKSGAKVDDPRVQQAVNFLLELKPTQTYGNALRGALLASLNIPGKYRTEIEYEKQWLLDAMFIDGVYGYSPPLNQAERTTPPGSYRDLSNTQYAALGMWLITDTGVEVPQKYWLLLQQAYLRLQVKDGGWSYPHNAPKESPGYQSMTLGALATLYIIWDRQYTGSCDASPPKEMLEGIKHGEDWLAKHFNPAGNAGRQDIGWFIPYTLYGVERVAVAGGHKYFGEKNWWELCARYVLFTQQPDGSWPACYESATSNITTSWMLLFLSYGRAPVVINKLAYGNLNQWNHRPRDLARLTTWMGKKYETLYSWQIAPIERPVDELLDAPILLISGKAALAFTAEQKAKLKDYVLGGGLLFGEASDGSVAFAKSFRELAKDLFPEQDLAALSADHPINSIHFRLQEKTGGGGTPPALEGLSNGVRTLMLLSTRDLTCAWQRNELANSRRSFELGGNLMEYAADRGAGLHYRGDSYAEKDLGHKAPRSLTVGRLAWGRKAQWDPEPAGWKRMDVLLRNANVAGIETKECDFAEAVDAKAAPLVHVTGVGAIALTDAQKQNLKKYVTDGGLLLADAAGGNKQFAESFDKLSADLFGPLVAATPDFLAAGTNNAKFEVSLRHMNNLPRSIRPINLLGWQTGGRWGVLALPYDLTAALAGNPNYEPAGLTPAAAEKFVTALVKSLTKAN